MVPPSACSLPSASPELRVIGTSRALRNGFGHVNRALRGAIACFAPLPRGVPEGSEALGEVVELVVRVQAARVREDPDDRFSDQFGLTADGGFGVVECCPICADTQHQR